MTHTWSLIWQIFVPPNILYQALYCVIYYMCTCIQRGIFISQHTACNAYSYQCMCCLYLFIVLSVPISKSIQCLVVAISSCGCVYGCFCFTLIQVLPSEDVQVDILCSLIGLQTISQGVHSLITCIFNTHTRILCVCVCLCLRAFTSYETVKN